MDAIRELMNAVDEYIPTPARDNDLPFLMAVEDVMTISGRGTVATGRVERGELKLNEPVEIVGIKDTQNTVVTGIEMFRKSMDFCDCLLYTSLAYPSTQRSSFGAICGTVTGRTSGPRHPTLPFSRRSRTSTSSTLPFSFGAISGTWKTRGLRGPGLSLIHI